MDAFGFLLLIFVLSGTFIVSAMYWEGRGITQGYLKYHMDVLQLQGKNPELVKGVSVDIEAEKNHVRRLELAKKAVRENIEIPVGGEDGKS